MSNHTAGLGHAFVHEYRKLHIRRATIKRIKHDARTMAYAIVGSTAFLLAVQLGYPGQYTTPFLRIEGRSVGLQNQQGVAAKLAVLEQQTVVISTYKQRYQARFAEIGVGVNEREVAREAISYSWRDRVRPFSLFRRGASVPVYKQYDDDRVAQWAKRLATENFKQPVSAVIQKQQGKYAVTPSQNGVTYDPNDVEQALMRATPDQGVVVVPPSQTVPPQFVTEDFQAAIQNVTQQVSQPFEITAEGHKLTITKEELATLTNIAGDASSSKVVVRYDREALKAKVTSLAGKIYTPATHSVVTLRDGAEISRVQGQAGRHLAIEESVNQIIAALERSGTSATLKAQPLTIASRSIRTYSSTSAGLQALLNDWLATHRGPRWGVVIRELGAGQRTASSRAAEQFVTASVYKPFVSLVAQSKIEASQLDPGAPTSTGKTVDACIELMIVHSDNACAHALGDMLGWQAITSWVQGEGFVGTSLPATSSFYTTANDTTAFLERLAAGTLMGAAQNERLLSMMRRQIYRNGIPAGSRGSAVANKVGYVDSYRHDVGIVYHPKGAYVLSILTYGGNYPQIVDLARTVHDYFSQ